MGERRTNDAGEHAAITIIAQLTQATSNLTDRLRELAPPAPQAAPPESREEAAQDAGGEPPGPAPQPGAAEAPAASEEPRRRSWWREFFGFGG